MLECLLLAERRARGEGGSWGGSVAIITYEGRNGERERERDLLVWLRGVIFGTFKLHLQPLHADLEAIHGLNSG